MSTNVLLSTVDNAPADQKGDRGGNALSEMLDSYPQSVRAFMLQEGFTEFTPIQERCATAFKKDASTILKFLIRDMAPLPFVHWGFPTPPLASRARIRTASTVMKDGTELSWGVSGCGALSFRERTSWECQSPAVERRWPTFSRL